jgi:hypothetical protein
MRLKICLLLVLLVSALFLGGCYTVLKHPEGAVLVDEYSNRRDCGDCHQASWFYHQDPYWYGANYYGTYYPYGWYDYYSRPWWYNDYWFYWPHEGSGGTVESGGRHMWSSPPTTLRPPDNISLPPAMKVPEGKRQSGTSEKQTPPESTGQKQKSTEKKRHLWDK